MTGVCGCGNHPQIWYAQAPFLCAPGSLSVSQCGTCHKILDLQTHRASRWQWKDHYLLKRSLSSTARPSALAYLRETLAASTLSSWRPETCCSAFLLVIQLRAGDEELMGFQADVFLIASLLVGKRHVSLEEMFQTTLEAIPHPLWWLRSESMMIECCWGCRETPNSSRWQRTLAKLLWPWLLKLTVGWQQRGHS